jgi:hypothetical protein
LCILCECDSCVHVNPQNIIYITFTKIPKINSDKKFRRVSLINNKNIELKYDHLFFSDSKKERCIIEIKLGSQHLHMPLSIKEKRHNQNY